MGVSDSSALCRAAAQLMAVSGCLGGEGWAAKLVRAITTELAASINEGRDPDRR